jgi:hypothetical protein
MKLLILHSSPASHHDLPLRPAYSPQQHTLYMFKHPVCSRRLIQVTVPFSRLHVLNSRNVKSINMRVYNSSRQCYIRDAARTCTIYSGQRFKLCTALNFLAGSLAVCLYSLPWI